MRLRDVSVAAVTAVAVSGMWLAVGCQTAPQPPGADLQMPRRDGKPDFSGIWRTNNNANWDLEVHTPRPIVGQPGVYQDVPVLAAPVVALGAIGWVPPDVGFVEGGQIPYQPWAADRRKENA